MKELGILVFGHKRPRALSYVLEGLRRQNALEHTEVWLDGHGMKFDLKAKVSACRALEQEFPQCQWFKFGSNRGIAKLFIDGATRACSIYETILFLEDDCFPGPDAVSTMKRELDKYRDNDEILSVYGAPRGTPDEERDGIFGTRVFGFMTTARKMAPVLATLKEYWEMPELDYLAMMEKLLTPELLERMCTPWSHRFAHDGVIKFIGATRGLKSRLTPSPVLFNFGVGIDSQNSNGPCPRFFQPPYNLTSEIELIERFDLPQPDWYQQHLAELDQTYAFDADAPNARFLTYGWNQPESWGIWSEGHKATLSVACSEVKSGHLLLDFKVRAFLHEKHSALTVDVAVNNVVLAKWEFGFHNWECHQLLAVPVELWREKTIAEIEFRISDPKSPSQLEAVSDHRLLGLGLISLCITGKGNAGCPDTAPVAVMDSNESMTMVSESVRSMY